MLKENTGISKYQAVKNVIIENINTGVFGPGSLIPSENEIAKQFGVSIVTARKALSDMVHDGYIYRIRGKGSFVSNSPKQKNNDLRLVAFLVMSDKEADSSTMQLIRGAQTYLSSKGYSLVVECSNDSSETERMLIESFVENGVAGMVIFPVDPDKNSDCYERLSDKKIPFVLVDRAPEHMPVNFVASYNMDGAYRIAQYLISMHHRKIAFAAMHGNLDAEKLRYEGYAAALSKNGIEPDPELYFDDTIHHMDRITALALDGKITAVMCINDVTAGVIINHFRKNGIRIPQDVSVTGFDDAEIAKYLSPSLTTVRQSFPEIGKCAATLLANGMENPDAGYSKVLLPTELVIRESVTGQDTF